MIKERRTCPVKKDRIVMNMMQMCMCGCCMGMVFRTPVSDMFSVSKK